MSNNFSDSHVIEYFRFENDASFANGGKGAFNLANHGATPDISDFKEGGASALFQLANSNYMGCPDADLPANFPLKNGYVNPKMTVGFWLKVNSTGGSQYILSKGSQNAIMWTYSYTGSIYIYSAGVSRIFYTGIGGADTWWHILLGMDSETGHVRFAIKNASTGEIGTKWATFRTVWAGNASDLIIGSRYNLSSYLDGCIDELVFWDKLLSFDEMYTVLDETYPALEEYRSTNKFSADASCVALYRFENGIEVGKDSVGFNHMYKTMYPNNRVVEEETSNYKQGSGCAHFTQLTGFQRNDWNLSTDFPTHSNRLNRKLSMAFWFKPETVSGERNIIGKGQRATGSDPEWYKYGWKIYAYNADLRFDLQYGTYNQSTETITLFAGALVAGRWYHLSFTYDIDTKSYYAELWDDTNSLLSTIGPAATANTMNQQQNMFWVGQYPSGSSSIWWKGWMDELAIFGDILSAADMAAIRGGTYNFSSDPDCISLYLFEPGSLNIDEKGKNTLSFQVPPYASYVGTLRKEGKYVGKSGTENDYAALRINEAEMDSGFPFKSTESNGRMALTFWMYPFEVPVADGYYKYICGKGSWYNPYNVTWGLRFVRQGTNDVIQLMTGTAPGANYEYHNLFSKPGLDLSRWYFVGFSLDGTTGDYAFYLYDSVAKSVLANVTGALSNALNISDQPFVMQNVCYNNSVTSHSEWPFYGYMDEFAIFNEFKDSTFFAIVRDALFAPPPSEVRMTRVDISGHSRDLSDVGSITAGCTVGKIGNGAYFNGAGEQSFTIGEAPDLSTDPAFTIAFRVKPHLSSPSGTDMHWHIKIGDLEIRVGFAAGQTDAYLSATAPSLSVASGDVLPADAWSFVTIWFDGSALYLGIDDTEVDSDSGASLGIALAATEIEMGFSAAVDMILSIDEVGIWYDADALTAAQRKTLYSGNYGQRPSFN